MLRPKHQADWQGSNPGATVIFTNYETGTDYAVIPEPGTIVLLGFGFVGPGIINGLQRRRSRQK